MAVVVFSGLGGVDFKSKSIAVLTQESPCGVCWYLDVQSCRCLHILSGYAYTELLLWLPVDCCQLDTATSYVLLTISYG